MFADDIGPSTKVLGGYMMSITVMNVIMDSYSIPKSQLSHLCTFKIGNAVNFMMGIGEATPVGTKTYTSLQVTCPTNLVLSTVFM